MNKDVIKDTAKMAHEKAAIDAKEHLPELDIIELIDLVVEVLNKKKTVIDAAKILAIKYKKPFEVYVTAFASITVEEGLKKSNNDIAMELGNEEFASKLVDTVVVIGKLVKDYYSQNISEEEFIKGICNSQVKDLGVDVFGAIGIDLEEIKTKAQNISPEMLDNLAQNSFELMPVIVSYIAFTEAYKILEEAKEDARIQHERRLLIEAECNKSIEMIKQYRLEMNVLVSTYLSEHIETFETGFKAMDQAIIDNDINGYIKGNNTIQEILGYDIQFTNEEEFDDLMNSDIAFKL